MSQNNLPPNPHPIHAFYGSVVKVGVASGRPTATGSGNLYFCTDISALYVDNPTTGAWAQFGVGQQVPTLGSAGSYTTVGSLSLTNYADFIRAAPYTNANNVASCALKAGSLSNTGTWVVNLVASFLPTFGTTYPEIGPVVTNGTTGGTSVAYAPIYYSFNSAQQGIGAVEFTVAGGRISALASNNSAYQTVVGGTGLVNLRLLNDATNLHFQASNDGFHWSDFFCQASISGLTNYGFMIGGEAGSGIGYCQGIIYRNDLTTLTVPQATITNATNASPIVITTSGNHNFLSGDTVAIHGVTGNTNANSGTSINNVGSGFFAWVVQSLSSNTFSLISSTGNSAYVSGGTATLIGR